MNAFQYATARTVLGIALLLALAGCASAPDSPAAAAAHPANAHAAASPMPPLQPGLLSITNLLLVKPVTEPAPGHHHGHEQHGTKPRKEEKK